MRKNIKSHFAEAFRVLNLITREDLNFQKLESVSELIFRVFENEGKVLTLGWSSTVFNAQYFSYILNNQGFESVSLNVQLPITEFFVQVGNAGDALVIFTTDGKEYDFVSIAKEAIKRDMVVIVFTGFDSGELRSYADIEIRCPETAKPVRYIELHIKMIHAITEAIEAYRTMSE